MSDAEVVDFVNSGEMIAKPDVGIPCPDLYYARMSQCMNGNVSMRPKFVDLYRCFGMIFLCIAISNPSFLSAMYKTMRFFFSR